MSSPRLSAFLHLRTSLILVLALLPTLLVLMAWIAFTSLHTALPTAGLTPPPAGLVSTSILGCYRSHRLELLRWKLGLQQHTGWWGPAAVLAWIGLPIVEVFHEVVVSAGYQTAENWTNPVYPVIGREITRCYAGRK